MVGFDGNYSMLFTGSFEVGRGYVTAVQPGFSVSRMLRKEAGST
jgi:hypothetical protein